MMFVHRSKLCCLYIDSQYLQYVMRLCACTASSDSLTCHDNAVWVYNCLEQIQVECPIYCKFAILAVLLIIHVWVHELANKDKALYKDTILVMLYAYNGISSQFDGLDGAVVLVPLTGEYCRGLFRWATHTFNCVFHSLNSRALQVVPHCKDD